MKFLKITAILFLVILGATFSTLNRQEISLSFFGLSTGPFPLFILVLAALIAGLAAGFSIGWKDRRQLRVLIRRLEGSAAPWPQEAERLSREEKAEPPVGDTEMGAPPAEGRSTHCV